MIGLRLARPAIEDPITVAEAKRWLRLDNTDEDDDIAGLISAATAVCETFTFRSFCSKGFIMTLDSFPYFVDTIMSQLAYPPSYYSAPRLSTTLWNYSQQIKILRPPLISVDRVTYLRFEDSQYHDFVAAPDLWYPGTVYAQENLPSIAGDMIVDNNANVQRCIVGGVSTAAPPTFLKNVNDVTVEVSPDPGGEGSGPVQWRNEGPLNDFLKGGTGGAVQFGNYLVDKYCEPGRIFPGAPGAQWPVVMFVPNAVQIHFTAGYGSAADVPSALKVAIKMLVANWYENREAAAQGVFGEIPNHIAAILWAYKVMDITPTKG